MAKKEKNEGAFGTDVDTPEEGAFGTDVDTPEEGAFGEDAVTINTQEDDGRMAKPMKGDVTQLDMVKAVEDAEEGKRKPETKVYDSYGKLERKKRAMGLGISDLLLPPYTRKSLAVYKLINSWQDGIPQYLQDTDLKDPATGERPPEQDAIFPGTYVFYDKFEKDPTKKQKTMFNYGRQNILEDEKGEKYLKREILDIEFVSGTLWVNVEQNYPLYLFMELHPLNASNKWRPNKTTTTPQFMRYDIHVNKSAQFRTVEMDLAYEAERAVVDEKDRDKIIGLAVTTGEVATEGKQTADIKADLRLWARNNPRKFFSMYGDVTPGIKLNILDCQGLGLIDYDSDKKMWIDAESGFDLCPVLIGKDPIDEFVKKLKVDKELYTHIRSMLDYWE